ncbi:glycosyltransferase family 2 protein [Endozoicomonas sp. SESOKO2]|uniref:glycosyltransferase family 2 protein n=1 Tax=Endozoicomonas sp. SESOKO2 TaxID=2828743 RepID=UPI0021482510|nr:glycosyltransferase family 2 protein [Endozoicomonas sp. SESOKO2]
MQFNTIKDELLKKGQLVSLNSKKKQTLSKNQPKGYIDYVSGLYLGGWVAYDKKNQTNANYDNCNILVNGTPVCQFVPKVEREDLLALPEINHGKGFDWQLPVKAIVKILKQSEKLTFSLSVHESPIQHEVTIEKDDFYRSVAKTLKSDLNHYISLTPLINEDSIGYLTEWNKLFLIDSLFQSGLYKELSTLFELIIPNLNFDKNAENEYYELLNKVRFNPDFIAAFLQQTGDQYYQHPLSDKITEVLCQLPYLKAKDLITSYSASAIEENLVESCTGSESRKFEFIENFPKDQIEGLMLWNNLTEELKKDYWPLLAGALQYQNRSHELKLINCDPSWYLKHDQGELNKNEALRLAITNPDNHWFALSFVVQALETNRDPIVVSELLKEYAWKIWNLDYFNTDSFCYVTDALLKDRPSQSIYKNLIEAFDNVLRYKISNNANELKRETFQKTLAGVINTGILCQFQEFSILENMVRPVLSLSEAYTDSLCFEELEAFDYNIYHEFKHFYKRIRKIKTFFNSFDSSHAYSNEELAAIVPELLTLKREFGVEGIDQHFLALSRYIQLTERTALFDLLKAIHIEMGDTFSALQLESCPESRRELMRKISEHGDKARRKDSYWFKAALNARSSEGHEETRAFIDKLSHFLKTSEQTDQDNNPDLIELLVSETLWLAKHDAIEGDLLQIIEPLASTKVLTSWLKLKLYVSLKLTEEQSSINVIHQLSDQFGGIANLTDTLELLNSTIADITDLNRQKVICRKITENGIYPYLKVIIYSCNKYESTRHQIIRDTWLNDLKSCGIDYAFVVGDAEVAHCDNDKIRLDVPDTYEELPHKSLRMFEFAAQSSSHQYYYKLDDDCVLNVKAMFGDPAFLGHDYFGRIVNRPMGGVDRSWHHQKSTTNEAKTSLDLSPELSSYGDGSTGYILSRNAINKMNQQAKSFDNIQLLSTSYFEDKLVGDLLSLSDIRCIDKGYNCVIRRNVANGRDVQIWDYGLLPNKVTNIKVLHTEDDQFRRNFYKQLHDEWSLEVPNLIYRDVTDDMSPAWLSASEQAPVLKALKVNKIAIEKAKVLGIIVGKNEQEFLPNLLSHHRKIGVEHFLFVDNSSSDNSIDYMLEQDDVSVFVATQDYKFSRFGVNWQETLCSHYCLGKWTLIIDSDELFVFDNFEEQSIQELVAKADHEHATAILSPMVDFYPKGSLDTADITESRPFYETCNYFDTVESMKVLDQANYGPFSNSKVYSAGVRERIFGKYNAYPQPNYLNQKYNLLKYNPGMNLIEGLHFMVGHKIFSKQCGIMHFKYHSKFHTKIVREIKSGQHWNNGAEYRRYLGLFNKNEVPQLRCKKASIKYRNSSDLKRANYISEMEW